MRYETVILSLLPPSGRTADEFTQGTECVWGFYIFSSNSLLINTKVN